MAALRPRGILGRAAALLLLLACRALGAQITFEERKDIIYDIVPKLRIKGTGFMSVANVDDLELTFLPSRVVGADYRISIQSDTILTLTLQEGRTWVNTDDNAGPQALYLSGAKLAGVSVMDDGVQVATVIPTPTVAASSRTVFMSATPRLVINGTNFNVKHTELYFDPPLSEGIDFQKQILSDKQISLIKKYSYDFLSQWGPEPGPLKLVAINTGGGRLSLRPDLGGVTIAELQTDLEGQSVTVLSHEELDIYQSTPSLNIQGDGFNPQGTRLRFANGLRGGGVNFTVATAYEDQLELQLSQGSKWRQNVESLPGALVLLAADAGAGWVALGPTAVKSGRRVATVFEDPTVERGTGEIWRTHSHELVIRGTGFNKEAIPVFKFQPPLDPGAYFTGVLNRTHVKLILQTAWTAEGATGDLKVSAVDTGAGLVTLPSPVTVAKVVDDSAAHESGVHVFPGHDKALYQSDPGPLLILGSGLKAGDRLALTFANGSPSKEDYDAETTSEGMLQLTLKKGRKWSPTGGPLILKSVDVGDGEVVLGGGKGIRVANILSDPEVFKGELSIYASHTKHFSLRGSGFVSTLDPNRVPKVVLDSTAYGDIIVEDDWTDNTITLRLRKGVWTNVNVGALEGGTAKLKVVSIDTGAGPVYFKDGGVTIAVVHEDSESTICEDSCMYSNDGQCDEPSGGGGIYGYGWGADDDANGHLDDDYASGFVYAGYLTTYMYGVDDDMAYQGGGAGAGGGFGGGAAACEPGTDCTDCGVQVVAEAKCENTCKWARDGACDDPRVGGICPEGTDCQDCGPWGDAGSNFTALAGATSSETTVWTMMDEEDDFLFDDDGIIMSQELNAIPVYKRTFLDHRPKHKEAEGAGYIFMDVLWTLTLLVGGSVSLGLCMLAYRHAKGQATPVPFPQQADASHAAAAGPGLTPDVVRVG